MDLSRQVKKLRACQLLVALQGSKSERRTQSQGLLTTSSMEAFSTFCKFVVGSDSLIRARIFLDCKRYLISI